VRILGSAAYLGGRIAFIAAVLACFGTACTRRGDRTVPGPQTPQPGGRLVVLSEPAQSLDPALADEVYESVVDRQIYEGLVALDAGLRLQPALASSWMISPDGLNYTFQIRPNVRFHDGSLLDAGTVAHSLERCLSLREIEGTLAESSLERIRGAAAFREGRAEHVEGIVVKDDRTLEINLDAPLSIFLKVLAMEQTSIVARKLSDSRGDNLFESNPVGTGPFRFAHRQATGGVCLSRFDEYWGVKALLDSLTFVPAPVGAQDGQRDGAGTPYEIQALSDRTIQFAELPSGTSAQARAAGLPVYRSPELSVSFMGLRCDLPPFDIPEVRRAALLAIRRDALIAVDPEGMVPAAGVLPPGLPGRDPGNRMPKPDPGEAARLLARSGHPGGAGLAPVSLAVSRTSNPRLYEPIVSDLRTIGLAVTVQRLDWHALDSLALRGSLQAFMMSWVADLPDPDAFLYPIFHSRGQSNLFGYRSARADSLLEAGRTLPAGPERNRIYADLQETVLQDAPLIPLYHNSLAYSWSPAVNGVDIGPCGFALVAFRSVWLHDGGRNLAQGVAK
jgi:oligopeptide transport system substrate-binding protein